MTFADKVLAAIAADWAVLTDPTFWIIMVVIVIVGIIGIGIAGGRP